MLTNAEIYTVPKRAPVQLKVRHRKFEDEINAGKEGNRTQRNVDHEDDAVEIKRKKKYESILTAPLIDPAKSPSFDDKKD